MSENNKPDKLIGTAMHSASSSMSTLVLDAQDNNTCHQAEGPNLHNKPGSEMVEFDVSKTTHAPVVTVDAQELKSSIADAALKISALTAPAPPSNNDTGSLATDRTITNSRACHLSHHMAETEEVELDEKTQRLRDLYVAQYGEIFDVQPYGYMREELATGMDYGDLMACEGQAWYSDFWMDGEGWGMGRRGGGNYVGLWDGARRVSEYGD